MKWFWIVLGVVCVIGTIANEHWVSESTKIRREYETAKDFKERMWEKPQWKRGDLARFNHANNRYDEAKRRLDAAGLRDLPPPPPRTIDTPKTVRLSTAERTELLERIKEQDARPMMSARLQTEKVKRHDARYEEALSRYERIVDGAAQDKRDFRDNDYLARTLQYLHRDIDMMLQSRYGFHGSAMDGAFSRYVRDIDMAHKRCAEYENARDRLENSHTQK